MCPFLFLDYGNRNLVDAANIAALAALSTFWRPEFTLGGEGGQEVIIHPPEVRCFTYSFRCNGLNKRNGVDINLSSLDNSCKPSVGILNRKKNVNTYIALFPDAYHVSYFPLLCNTNLEPYMDNFVAFLFDSV